MKKRFFALFLLFSLFIAGCQTGQDANADFNTFCMETFRSYAASDSLTLNYTLMSPKKYGITDLPDGFSSFSLHDLKQMQTSTENTLARLRSFASKNLSREDRLLYDTLDASLTLSQEDIRMLAHSYSFDPSSGIQAQLPVLLCEFILTDKQDYDQYFSLLKSIPAYFNSLTALEKAKQKKGTLPSATTIRHTIRQCQEFVDSSGTDAIEKSFEKSINSASFFSASEKKERLEKHRKLLSHSLFPAYKNLIAELGKLLPFAPNDGALAAYTGGRAYYEYLVKEKTGTISSPDSLFQMLTKKLSESEQKLATLAATSPSSFLTCEKHTSAKIDSYSFKEKNPHGFSGTEKTDLSHPRRRFLVRKLFKSRLLSHTAHRRACHQCDLHQSCGKVPPPEFACYLGTRGLSGALISELLFSRKK